MRILIDECVDQQLRFFEFAEHECETAQFAGLDGMKNGRLLDAAEAAGFDVLITVDQSIPDQRSRWQGRKAGIDHFVRSHESAARFETAGSGGDCCAALDRRWSGGQNRVKPRH